MQLVLTSTSNIQYTSTKQTLSGGIYNFTLTLNVPSLTPIYAADLLRPDFKSLATDDKTKNAIQTLAFLAYKEKFVAGGWEYLVKSIIYF